MTHELLAVLRMALKREIILPERKMRTSDEFFKRFPGVKEIWIDGTERPVRRPKDSKRQKRRYSGKKKRHTVKNMVVSDRKKRILMVGRTQEGRRPDYALFKKLRLPGGILPGIKCWLDSGFQGIEKDYPDLRVSMPKRAVRNRPLAKREKENNRRISGKRVLIENAIGGIKRLRSLTDVCLNRIGDFEDRLMLVGAGLWNWHLKMA